jgi:hypothetical protein
MDEQGAHEQPRSFQVVLIDKLKPQLEAAEERLKTFEENPKEDEEDEEGGEEQVDDRIRGDDGDDAEVDNSQEDKEDSDHEPFEPDDDN